MVAAVDTSAKTFKDMELLAGIFTFKPVKTASCVEELNVRPKVRRLAPWNKYTSEKSVTAPGPVLLTVTLVNVTGTLLVLLTLNLRKFTAVEPFGITEDAGVSEAAAKLTPPTTGVGVGLAVGEGVGVGDTVGVGVGIIPRE